MSKNSRRRVDKRAQFFARQSEACTKVGGPPNGCWCPLCGEFFNQADLDARRLTLEHVPPRSVGGKEMCLTCADCNNTAGSAIDASVSELASMQQLNTAVFFNKGNYSGPVSLSTGGVTVNAKIDKIEGQPVRIEIHEWANNPERVGDLNKHLDGTISSGTEWRFELSARFRTSQKKIFASLVRSGYLAAFSLLGYRYTNTPRLNVVRRQIVESDVEHIPRIGIILNHTPNLGNDGPIVAAFSMPFPGVAVYFSAAASPLRRAATVLLPWVDGPEDFYRALLDGAQGPAGKKSFSLTVAAAACPTGPALWCDFA